MKVNKFVNDLRGQTKAKLFEVPKKPLPTYFHEYQNMLLLKIHVCQEIIESNENIQLVYRRSKKSSLETYNGLPKFSRVERAMIMNKSRTLRKLGKYNVVVI
ncbi:unnamed protein product [Rhizophagus irregularis]|uniref:Uncharacterized protein n=1 Tax=Rhizophagus irregularis TaxID=588596 RepID=A0A915YZV9_9GLOM|nr:unnamed protein product [Rhizophagus irregularis]CAB5110536.1 unnamed protein product [Rhizophagus irregularis]CAB5356127.1 unnamed protein product [Rhizophagus irregularis]